MHPDEQRGEDQWRQRQRSGVVGGALATAMVAGLAYHQLATDPQRAGALWAAHALLMWLGIGADVGAIVWLFSGQGWDQLLSALLVGLLGAAGGGLASDLPDPLGLAGQRSGTFGGWLAVLLGASLLSGLRLSLQHHARPALLRRTGLHILPVHARRAVRASYHGACLSQQETGFLRLRVEHAALLSAWSCTPPAVAGDHHSVARDRLPQARLHALYRLRDR